MSKRELVLGTLIVLMLVCSLTDWMIDVSEQMHTVGLAMPHGTIAAQILGWVLTFSSLASVILGAVITSGIGGSSLEKLRQLSLKATIPVYFVFALVPAANGMVLLIAGETQWGMVLACLSVPASVVFLALGLWCASRQAKS